MTKQMMVLIAALVYVLIRCIFVEPNSLEVTKYVVHNAKLSGVRVVFLSDFHLKRRDYKRLDKIVSATNRINPDVVLLGGDFAVGHNYENTMNIDIAAQKLSLIKAPIFAVLGEHDWWTDGRAITDGLRRVGITVLSNSNRRMIIRGRYIDIVGLDDLTTRQPNLALALNRTARPRIIVTHNPDVYYDIIDDVDLILAGHTHGGQFIIPFTPPLFVPSKFGAEFASGEVKSTRNLMIISKGLGTSILPVRFNCKPEIVVVEFQS